MARLTPMPEQQMDPRKVRIGLAMVVVTVVAWPLRCSRWPTRPSCAL